MTAPFVDIADGHRLFVRDWGSGRPVLLLAGWAMDSRIWGATMVALQAAGLRVTAYDRRGHGRSTDPGRIDYDLLADDLAAVIETLDLNDLTLVAHSGASGEVIRYVTRHGAGRVGRIILVGATGPCMLAGETNPNGVPREGFEAVVAQIETNLASWIEDNAQPFAPTASTRVINWLSTMVLDTSRRMAVDFQRVIGEADFRQEAAAIDVPVTIIHGDLDASAPIDLTARRFAQIVPQADLLVYEGVAHGIMITDAQRLAGDIVAQSLR
ncbi:non-heme chloroperoxidase [Polymorphobacter multimanifer]|uniref:Pimeloyl-ACP methyl ester carboxylesterase n=1 Tax=Polymorphobacter multimanifer TaxID=1070431 RepID=A0A841L8B9_9SPHN|nr:alpha/beta hydrolase [Polymorphobacter multimanifer]MBB6229269.1 pimeloyl-ACP methyl ester carboxylesterase [Polymorphobacter multimanifer]GGI85421.1 non-heme chloroperoxidase [Polymorphobacter multimanifer]